MSDGPQTPLQFDTVGSPSGATCQVCQSSISGSYYTVGGQVTCTSCRAHVEQALSRSSGFAGALRATVQGSIPGALGAALWWAVRRFASLEIGLIAVGIGHFVGVGVRNGSGGRGGWKYQTLAVVLTYFWITANYVPDIIGLAQAPREQTAAVGQSAPPTTGSGTASVGGGAERTEPPTLAQFAVAVVFLFGIAMAAPFLQGAENIIGILIISFGLYQAWTLNRRVRLDVAGPFHLSPAPTPAPVPNV